MEYDALNRELLNPKTVLTIMFLFQPVTKELSEEVDEQVTVHLTCYGVLLLFYYCCFPFPGL